MPGFDVINRSSVLALSPEQLGIRLGSDINCDRSFTMAKDSASRPAGLVICEEWVSQFGLYTLKSPRMVIAAPCFLHF